MKITDKRKQSVLFSDLKEGDLFEIGDDDIYMKTMALLDDDFYKLYNAVSLKSGEHELIQEDQKVFKINGELVIE